MDVFALTRAFIDIESVTGNELAIGQYFHDYLKPLADKHGGQAERIEVEKDRYNVYAHWGRPEIVFSTHLDTVPPFIPSKEDDEFVWGRGACDTKGISASMITASEALLEEGVRDFAMLFVVGEEVDGIGAHFANAHSPGPKYLINGEPTENKLALGSKGNLRIEIEAKGKMAHSAYAELGDSAINKLLDNLERLRNLELPVDPVLGDSTCSIGLISGGRAANVIPDHASATAVVRVVSDMDEAIEQIDAVFDDRVTVSYPVRTPRDPHEVRARFRDDRRQVHNRYPQADQLGPAATARARNDSRCAYRRRAGSQEATHRGRGTFPEPRQATQDGKLNRCISFPASVAGGRKPLWNEE